MKKTLVAALTAALIVGAGSTTFAAANPFSDVPVDHWAYRAVTDLAGAGIVGYNYGDETFRGNRNVTRSEFGNMASALLKKLSPQSTKAANELSEDLSKNGEKLATRYEIAVVLADVYNQVKGNPPAVSSVFPDVPNDHWAKNAVDLLGSLKIMEGYGDGTFRGDRPMTRFEAALLIDKMYRGLWK